MQKGVQNLAGRTSGVVILPFRRWSSQPSGQLTNKARKGVKLHVWES